MSPTASPSTTPPTTTPPAPPASLGTMPVVRRDRQDDDRPVPARHLLAWCAAGLIGWVGVVVGVIGLVGLIA